MTGSKIKSIKSIGKHKTYNLTMKSSHHNYEIIDENAGKAVISRNSHSACYGFLSYQTAYLKAYFPEEFMCAYLNVELNRAKYEKIEILEKDCVKNNDIKILTRNLNKCAMNYEIVSKKDESSGISHSQIRPPIRCKGLSRSAAEDIINNAPYSDMRDFAFKTSPQHVDTKSVESLAIAGFFKNKDENGKRIPIEHHVKQFSGLREDLKRSRRKGVMSQDIFE